MSIQEHLNKIRNAVYGHEVRESIAKGIETAYDDASEKDNANMEVKIARGTHPNLRSRLEEVDNKQQQTTTQLQQTEQELSAQLAQTVKKDEGGVVTPAMLSQETKEQMTGGSVAIVGKNTVLEENIVDKQVTARKTDFLSVKELNLFNKYDPETVDGKGITETGLTDLANFCASHYIPIEPGKTYERPTVDTTRIYDIDKNDIWSVTSSGGLTFTALENWAYVRLNIPLSMKETAMFAEAPLSETYQPFGSLDVTSKEIEALIKNTVAIPPSDNSYSVLNAIGDSLTDATNDQSTVKWCDFIKDWFAIPTLNNYGISGSCVGDGGVSNPNPMSVRYTGMGSGDLNIIFGGVNDYGKNVPLGTMADRTKDTFYGALHVLLSGMIEKYPSNKIGYIGFHRFGAGHPATQNSLGLTPQQYIDAIKEVCSHYSIPMLNLFEEGGLYLVNTTQRTVYTTDGLHFNDIGQEYIAKLIYKWIRNHL